MRASQAFLFQHHRISNTSKTNVSKLMQDGGFFQQISPGLFAWLPLGMLVINHVRDFIDKELAKIGAAEIHLPLLSSRTKEDRALQNFRAPFEQFVAFGKGGNSLSLASTYEETMAELIKACLNSQTKLPLRFYQDHIKLRDLETRLNDILSASERQNIDCFGIYSSYTGMNNDLPKLFKLAMRVFQICGLKPWVAEGLPAYLSGLAAQDFIIGSRNGDYTVVRCEKCGYTADQKIAIGLSKLHNFKLLPLVEGLRADVTSAEELVRQVGIPATRMGQCLLWVIERGIVMTLTRGDQIISLAKLGQACGNKIQGPLPESEYANYGFVPEFLSPLNVNLIDFESKGITVVIDHVAAETPNLLMGQNAKGRYAANANFVRDYDAHIKGDICLVDERNRCYHCGGALKIQNAIKLASLNRIDDFFSRLKGIAYTNESGNGVFPFMASLVFNLERLVLALAQENRDKHGLRWPVHMAPYKAVLIAVGKSSIILKLAQSMHENLSDLVLWDERSLSVSQKFKEANRMGIPLRIILSPRSVEKNELVLIDRFDREIRILNVANVRMQILKHCQKPIDQAGLRDAL